MSTYHKLAGMLICGLFLGASVEAATPESSSMPPILGVGKMSCGEIKKTYGFDNPVVTSWLEGFITGMESARISYMQIWGRRIGVATPKFIAMELQWRCENEGDAILIAVLATRILEEIPSDFPGEDEE